MKIFQKIALLLVATLALHLRAETNDVVKFSGTVVDAQGNAVADALVDCYRFPSRMTVGLPDIETKQRVMTDSKGAFAFSISSGAVTVTIKKAGHSSAWKTWQSVPSGVIDPLVLSAPSMLAGVVVDEKDRPIAGAEVSVSAALDKGQGEWETQPNFLFGKPASGLFSARTSADGHFRIADFPAGAQAKLAVSVPGRALRTAATGRNGLQLEAQAGEETIKLVTDPAASIEGKVVIRDTGAPLAHAKIQLQGVNSWTGSAASAQSIQSGADGAFRISELPAGAYHVTAIFTNEPVPLWVSENVPVTVAAGETVRDVKIQAFKGGIVEVTVVGKGGQKGLSGAVSAYSEGYQVGGTSGADGVAWLRLPPGQVTVFATRQGMSQAQTETTVVDGETNRVKLELNLPSKIVGVIKDASGSPVANTSVGVFPNFNGNNSDSKSDASGHFEVTWQQPSWRGMQEQRYFLVARNAERKLAALHEIEETTTSLDLDLKGAMSISGRVQDVKGNAISNTTGYLILQMENTGFSLNRQPIHSDDQGRIQIEGLPLGEQYTLNVSAKGYGSGQQKMEAADAKADHYDFPPMVLKVADRKLAGRLLGTDGQPVAGAQVWMRGDGQPNDNTQTDANGRFAFDAVCEGPVSVSANSKGLSSSYNGKGGDTNVVIRFNANNRVYNQTGSLTISGVVYDPSGNPASGAHVSVTPSWGQVDSATTGVNGEYSIHWQAQQGMRGAKYFVVARDINRNLAGMEEIDEKKTNASVRLEPGLSISGTVEDADGKPITRANVNLNMMVGNMGGLVAREPIKLDADGTFTIPALPKGQQYNVHISAADHGSMQKNITKNQSQTNSIQLAPCKLKTADRQLAGQVLGIDGKPLSGAQINTYGNNQPNVNARTDDTGHFKVKVCDGPISIYAYVPQGNSRNNYAQVQARGGDMNVVVKMGATQQRQTMPKAISLKPQPWTLTALVSWPTSHKAAAVILLALQTMVLLGAGGGVFWMTRKRKN